MVSLIVMTTTVAVWLLLLPAAGDVVSGCLDHEWNTTATYNCTGTEPPRNSTIKQLIYYRVSRLIFTLLAFYAPTSIGGGL